MMLVSCIVLFNVSVKEKRWVIFKGEDDPTSIPGNCFYADFCSKLLSYLRLFFFFFIYFIFLLIIIVISVLLKWEDNLLCLYLFNTFDLVFDCYSWVDMLAKWAAEKGSITRGITRNVIFLLSCFYIQLLLPHSPQLKRKLSTSL